MSDVTIDHARLEIVSLLNRRGDEFEDLKKEIFSYNEKFKCWESKIADKTEFSKEKKQ